jgi:hypothetical protein
MRSNKVRRAGTCRDPNGDSASDIDAIKASPKSVGRRIRPAQGCNIGSGSRLFLRSHHQPRLLSPGCDGMTGPQAHSPRRSKETRWSKADWEPSALVRSLRLFALIVLSTRRAVNHAKRSRRSASDAPRQSASAFLPESSTGGLPSLRSRASILSLDMAARTGRGGANPSTTRPISTP